MECSAVMGAAVWGISFHVIPEEDKTISPLFWVKSKELEGVMAVVRMNGRGK